MNIISCIYIYIYSYNTIFIRGRPQFYTPTMSGHSYNPWTYTSIRGQSTNEG